MQARSDVCTTGIFDNSGRQCGVLLGDSDTVQTLFESGAASQDSHKIVLLFRQKPSLLCRSSGFTLHLPNKQYLEPFGDYYARNDQLGDISVCFFMLVRRVNVWYERVTVGILHGEVWSQAGPEEIEVLLL